MKLPRRNKVQEKAQRSTLKELPYFTFRGSLALFHGQFNNWVSTTSQCRRHLDKLSSLFDLDLFTNLDGQLNNNNNDHKQCRYLSLRSFKLFNRKLSNSEVHNNVVSINENLQNLTLLLDELDLQFNLIGVTETKITNSKENGSFSCIPGSVFDFVPIPLASGGIGLFIHESQNYTVLENKISNEGFQALWIEIFFVNNKNIIPRIIYRQHNSPDQFISYFEETIEKLTPLNKMYSSWAISI